MSDPIRAVFLSYAREDTAAAQRIAEALRSHSIEVWFDQSELRGGDAWDQKIRKQIRECALFVPIISDHTQERHEGYFRLEWKLAVDRTHLILEGVPFLAPVVIDDTPDSGAAVPAEFLRVQWTRLSGALPTPQFVEQVKRLLDTPRKLTLGGGGASSRVTASMESVTHRKSSLPGWVWAAVGAAAVAVVAFFFMLRKAEPLAAAPPPAKSAEAEVTPAASVAATDDKSVAVLAFADLSEGHNSEFFSDGISEALLDVLAKVPGLKVTARTSSFFFKGRNLPISEIAQKLNVAYVIEGSVQRVGENVRITAQLIKASDGYQVWSDHFDGELKNVFALQDEIAGIVATNLSLKLGASSAPSTAAVNPDALEFYLQARQLLSLRDLATKDLEHAEDLLNRALALEPHFARALAAIADVWYFRESFDSRIIGRFDQRNSADLMRIAAKDREALAIDPDSPEAHTSLGGTLVMGWNFAEAESEYRRAISLNPNLALAHSRLSNLLVIEGRMDESLAEGRIASQLDPLSQLILEEYGRYLDLAGRHREALPVFDQALALSDSTVALGHKGYALAQIGRMDEAVALAHRLPSSNPIAAAIKFRIYALAGLRTEAEALLPQMKAMRGQAYSLLVLNRPDEALVVLDPHAVHEVDLHDWLFEPWIDPIKDDPRFVKFLATLGITEDYARAQAWRAAHPPELPTPRG